MSGLNHKELKIKYKPHLEKSVELFNLRTDQ